MTILDENLETIIGEQLTSPCAWLDYTPEGCQAAATHYAAFDLPCEHSIVLVCKDHAAQVLKQDAASPGLWVCPHEHRGALLRVEAL